MMNADVFRSRRARVMDAMAARGGGVAVHFTAPERLRNRDSEYPYRFDSSFWYLTGFPEPGAALVLRVAGTRREAMIFCRPRDAEREIWEGFRYRTGGRRNGLRLRRRASDRCARCRHADAAGRRAGALLCTREQAPSSTRACSAGSAICGAKARSGTRAPTALLDLAADRRRAAADQGCARSSTTMRRAAAITASGP